MKRLLPLSFMLLLAGHSFGQITLTAASHGMAAGDSFVIFSADTTGVQPGPAGASQTWNFSSLNVGTTSTPFTYDALAGQTFAGDFPNANLVLDDGSGDVSVYESNANVFSLHGINNSTVGSNIYSDPQILFNFPVSFGGNNVNNDAFAGTYSVAGFTINRSGTSSTVADGHGTLILPSGTFNNVLRVKITSSFDDVTLVGTIETDQVVYNWYDATHKNFLLSIAVVTTVTPFIGTTVTKVVNVLDAQGTSSLQENFAGIGNLSLFTNPLAESALQISMDVESAGKYELSVFSADGKIAYQEADLTLPQGRMIRQIELADLPSGLYMLTLQGEGGRKATRFVKQ